MTTSTDSVSTTINSDSTTTAVSPQTRRPRWVTAVVMVGLYWCTILAVNTAFAGTFAQFMTQFWAPMILVVGLTIWWLALSRVGLSEKLIVLFGVIAGGVAASQLIDKSMAIGLVLFTLPTVCTAWALGVALGQNLSSASRVTATVLAICACWGYATLIRCEGITGSMDATIAWRWDPTSEERFLAEHKSAAKPIEVAADPSTSADSEPPQIELLVKSAGDWTGFRGPQRDSRVTDTAIRTNWDSAPPKAVWKQRIGPGWSSFTVVGDRLFTQEQRGESEAVVCYESKTGKELWYHVDNARFWEVVAGAGPRSTPEFCNGYLYSVGANGQVNCLNAATGKLRWNRDLVADTGAKIPQWGFSSSPTLVNDVAVVYAGGTEGRGLVAYRIDNGDITWTADVGNDSYASVQMAQSNGETVLIIPTGNGLAAVDATKGEVLWNHSWPGPAGMARITQPLQVGNDRVLLGTGYDMGLRSLKVSRESGKWNVESEWTSRDLKPYFNDFVFHEGTLYGFDGAIFTSVDANTGKRNWKNGRYNYGQVLLLADQKLLLVIAEDGKVVLLEANPKKHVELASFQAIDGKTWNHPVVARGLLFVRNSEEAACYDLRDSAGETQVTATP